MHSPASPSDLLIAKALLDIALVLAMGTMLGRLVHRIRQPVVIGEILAGIALGPSLLGLLPGNATGILFPPDVRTYLQPIAQVGLTLFMFLIGWEFSLAALAKRRHTIVAVSAGSILVPCGLGIALAGLLYPRHASIGTTQISPVTFALFIGTAMSITAFPVLARILTEYGLNGTPVGTIALASAAIGDVIALCLLALISAIATSSGLTELLQMLGLLAAYLIVLIMVVRPVLATLVRRWASTRPAPHLLVLVISAILVSAYATTWIGVHAIFGAFCVGLVMPREPNDVLRAQVRQPVENISVVLLPVFFIVTGLAVDIGTLSRTNMLELAAIIAVACIGKLAGAIVPARTFGLSWRDARTLGILINTRGLTELIVLSVGVQMSVLDDQMFTMMVLMALVTTIMVGPLIRPTDAPIAHHDRTAVSALRGLVPGTRCDDEGRVAGPGVRGRRGLNR